MGNYAPPRFSTVGTQEKLEALGFRELDLDAPIPAVDALRKVQPDQAPRITIMHSFYHEEMGMAANIILQNGQASIVSLFMDHGAEDTPRDSRNNIIPFLVTEHFFLNNNLKNGAELTEFMAIQPTIHLASALRAQPKTDGDAMPGHTVILPSQLRKIAPGAQPN